MNDKFEIAFTRLFAKEQTSDGGDSDEPYALFATVDLAKLPPAVVLFRTKVFGDVDDAESRKQHISIWGPNQQPQAITDPDKIILLAAMMENDGCDPNGVLTAVTAQMIGNAISLLTAGPTPRSKLVEKLINAFNGALDNARKISTDFDEGFNADDRMGSAQELRITQKDLENARKSPQERHLDFSSEDLDGAYRLHFEISTVKN